MVNIDTTPDTQIDLSEELAEQLNIGGIDEDGVDLLAVLDALSCGALALVRAPGVATTAYYKVIAPNAEPGSIAFAAQRLGQSVAND